MITAYGNIQDGKFFFANRKKFDHELSKVEDCIVELSIRKKNKRSTQQNRYYWSVVIQNVRLAMVELGNKVTDNDVHDFLKERFNAVEIFGTGGEVIGVKGGSTTDLNKSEFMEYIDKIIQFAAEYLSISIPLPNEKLEFNYD